jgi:hypothetical protein
MLIFDAEEPRYERDDRDRSASPRPSKREDDYPVKRDDSYRGGRDRSASPNGRIDSRYVRQWLMNGTTS